jgi:membrane protease YdiL (CAAX protease family)
VGVLITLGLFLLERFLTGAEGPADTPSHPMVQQLFEGNVATYVQLLLLGSVAAPIVEETMFRGVLYRHLRDATGRWRIVWSVLFAMLVNSFIFAVIHPQGLLAVPALMGLAFNFTLMREWRGTLIPSIIMHGIQNGLVFTALFVVVSQG